MKKGILLVISVLLIGVTLFGCGESEETISPNATYTLTPDRTSTQSPGSAPASTGEELLNQARELQVRGDYDEAIEKYQAFIDGDHYISEDGEYFSSYDAENAIGAIYKALAEDLESQGLYDEAVEKYQAFIDGDYYISEDGEYFSS